MPQFPGRFVGYEIAPVAEIDGDGINPCSSMQEATALSERTFWSLYGTTPEGTAMCIGDYREYEWCAEIYSRITGHVLPDNPDGLRLTALPAYR